MFNPLTLLDGIQLEMAQKFCDKVQRTVGMTKFTLQKWAIISSAIFFSSIFVFRPKGVEVMFLLIVYVIGTVFIVLGTEIEEAEFLRDNKLQSSPWHNVFLRSTIALVFECTAALSLLPSSDEADWLWSFGGMSYIAFGYFSACIPRPPSKSNAREWYEKVLTVLNSKLQPAPVPTN